MTSGEIREYRGFVAAQLAELTPYLQEYALGDFSRDIEIPEEENEFTELLVALRLFVDDIRELIQDLEESEERFRGTFEQAAVGAAHVSPQGQLLMVNHRLCEILGYSESELKRLTFMDFTHPDDLEADVELFNELAAGSRKSYAMEKRYVRKDGKIVWGALTVSMIRHDDGSPKYAIGVVEDISDRKSTETELEKYRSSLEELVEERTSDLRQTINMMAGREVRMSELKESIRALRSQLVSAGLDPVREDPLESHAQSIVNMGVDQGNSGKPS